MSEPLFDKKEIQQILKKASEIQTQKDLYGDKEGLTRSELEVLAKEVGIDADSLNQAILNRESDTFDTTFNWIAGTSKVQDVAVVEGEVNEENWDEIIREIRKVIGGIGKDSRNRDTFEWEQRLKDIGYRHISLTAKNGKTTIQYVYSWQGIKFIAQFFSFIFPFTITAISFDGSTIPFVFAILSASIAGGLGILASRVFLKPFFEKQKRTMKQTIKAISQKLTSREQPKIEIEENAYLEPETSSSSTNRQHES
jgi:hypothetical protein